MAAGLARSSNVWHKFVLNLRIGGDCGEHVIWRVDNLSFPASIKYYTLWYQVHQIQ